MPNYQMTVTVNYDTDAPGDRPTYRVDFNDACDTSVLHMASLLLVSDNGLDRLDGAIPMYDYQGNDVTEKVGTSMGVLRACVNRLFA